MRTFLNLIGIAGFILMLAGFVTLDSEGIYWKISIAMSIVGVILINIWLQTEGRQWAN